MLKKASVIIAFLSLLVFFCFELLQKEKPQKRSLSRQELTKRKLFSDLFVDMPEKEKEALSCLCTEVLRYGTVGYTLFGNKPVSSFEVRRSLKAENFLLRGTREIFFYKALPLLKKYQKQLEFKNYIFDYFVEGEYLHVYVINKKAFLLTVKNNQDLFEGFFVAHAFQSAEDLLTQIERRVVSFHQLFNENDLLLGLLYGFGRGNAMKWTRRSEISSLIKQQKAAERALEEEFALLNKELVFPFQDSSFFDLYVLLPGFCAGKNDDETQCLVKEYKETKNYIRKILASEDLLGVIFDTLEKEL